MITIKKAKLNAVGYLEIDHEERMTNEAGENFTVEASTKCTWDPAPELLEIFDLSLIHI